MAETFTAEQAYRAAELDADMVTAMTTAAMRARPMSKREASDLHDMLTALCFQRRLATGALPAIEEVH